MVVVSVVATSRRLRLKAERCLLLLRLWVAGMRWARCQSMAGAGTPGVSAVAEASSSDRAGWRQPSLTTKRCCGGTEHTGSAQRDHDLNRQCASQVVGTQARGVMPVDASNSSGMYSTESGVKSMLARTAGLQCSKRIWRADDAGLTRC